MRKRHVLTVQRTQVVKGSLNQDERVPLGDPITVHGNAHPLTVEEIQYYGDRGRETRKWASDTWPGDMFSTITFHGDPWEQVEPAQRADIGDRTKHVEVIIRKRA